MSPHQLEAPHINLLLARYPPPGWPIRPLHLQYLQAHSPMLRRARSPTLLPILLRQVSPHPTLPQFQADHCTDSSPLSEAPTDPVWPEICTASDCPVRGTHFMGNYRHNNEPPPTPASVFGFSNPPPHVWDAYRRTLLMVCGKMESSVENDMILMAFLRYHVDDKTTRFWDSSWAMG